MKTKQENGQGITPGNAFITRVQVSADAGQDYRGERDYRTVFHVTELERLYVDVSVLNKRVGEEAWSGVLSFRLLYLAEGKAVCLSDKQVNLKFAAGGAEGIYSGCFAKEDLPGDGWQEGVYRVEVEMEGCKVQSEDIYLEPGDGKAVSSFRIIHAALDRVCGETEEMAARRAHSFRMMAKDGLENVRFLLVAQNLLGKEWVYEFIIRVVARDGRLKAARRAKAAQFMKDQAGNSLLCFGMDLGVNLAGEEGEYTVLVSFGGEVVLALPFAIGEKDMPYDFGEEIASGGVMATLRQDVPVQYSAEAKEEIMDRLYRLVGLRKVKEEITRIMEYAEFVCLRREHGFQAQVPSLHLIFSGHPGTGKNTVAALMGELYHALGLLSNGRVNRFRRQDLVQDGKAVEEELVRRALQASQGGILFIEDAADLFCPEDRGDRGVVALGTLYSILVREHPEVMVILADAEERMDAMLEALPDLQKIFTKRLCFEDYTPEELMEITRHKLEQLQYRFTPAAEEKFHKQLQAACATRQLDFTNGRYIDEQIEEAARQMARRLMSAPHGEYKKEDLMLIREEDIVTPVAGDPEKPLEALNAMVGLSQLKRSIVQHLNYVYFIRERQKQGFSDVLPPLNMIFMGNPGTGKTTVVKMMGEIYRAAGILSRQDVLIQDARSLMAETNIPPAQLAESLLDAAAGGILYLSYADALAQTDYGLALFEELLAGMPDDECGGTLVVLGGYPDRMQQLLKAYPSLSTYFPYVFHFNDYTPEELLRIAENRLERKHYLLQPKAREALAGLIRKACENRDRNFGNALLVEKIVEMLIHNMSDRTMRIRRGGTLTRQDLSTVREEDVPAELFPLSHLLQAAFDEKEISAALEDLNRLVGQPGIKKQINDFVELARHYNAEGTKLSSKMSLQWCFTGNSGMGKGTVARIIARLYQAMGIISTGQVWPFKVERMVGLTEEEAQRSVGEALMRAEGGILLFDEDSPKLEKAAGLRERVRAILMNQLAERPGSQIIIYATPRGRAAGLNGGAEQMSEVVNLLVFEDYTREELMDILKRRLQKENMKMTTTARQYMNDFLATLVATEERSHASSRVMRIVADMIVRNCLQRSAKGSRKGKAGSVLSVQKQDVSMFDEQFVAGIMKERKRIGFV